jgi:hypothetical protein
MADFVQNSTVKSAVRTLAEPFTDLAAFNTVVESVITSNPFGCAEYMTAGVTHQPVEATKEAYVAKIVYVDTEAKTVGNDSGKYNSVAGFTAGAASMLANATNAAAHGGTAVRDFAGDTYSKSLRCHDPNGELYYVTFSRQQVTLTSYSDDAIRTKVEDWADTIPALA